MEIVIKRVSDDVVHLAVAGVCRDSIESPEVGPLDQVPMNDIHRHTVLVDMQHVTLLNSNGIGWLLVCHKRCREAGGRWLVHSLTPMSQKVLRLMRIDTVLDVSPSEQQALHAAGVSSR